MAGEKVNAIEARQKGSALIECASVAIREGAHAQQARAEAQRAHPTAPLNCQPPGRLLPQPPPSCYIQSSHYLSLELADHSGNLSSATGPAQYRPLVIWGISSRGRAVLET